MLHQKLECGTIKGNDTWRANVTKDTSRGMREKTSTERGEAHRVEWKIEPLPQACGDGEPVSLSPLPEAIPQTVLALVDTSTCPSCASSTGFGWHVSTAGRSHMELEFVFLLLRSLFPADFVFTANGHLEEVPGVHIHQGRRVMSAYRDCILECCWSSAPSDNSAVHGLSETLYA